ncbi:hypothetical protein CH253_08065 [Rhodococcus sp. 06-156-3C]|uniref:hypothetical protein n=1 Tax=Rhodococcus sp. 06-156-3C TaxID=2022486 RepID=UPI000B9BED3C|nr:hypothetical protein [Rhodococcus sp. 06-156-3C]OZD23808.1 hypothetical protein CH253_08065 [Rhodococcus sp. 06-156-3C]
MAFTIGGYTIPQLRKSIAAAVGVAALILTAALADFADFLPAGVATAGATVAGFLTIAGVFLARMGTLIDGIGSNGFGNLPDSLTDAPAPESVGKHRAK